MTIFDKAWAVLKELEQDDDVPSVARGTETGQPEDEMHAPGTCPVCDKKRAMQEGQ